MEKSIGIETLLKCRYSSIERLDSRTDRSGIGSSSKRIACLQIGCIARLVMVYFIVFNVCLIILRLTQILRSEIGECIIAITQVIKFPVIQDGPIAIKLMLFLETYSKCTVVYIYQHVHLRIFTCLDIFAGSMHIVGDFAMTIGQHATGYRVCSSTGTGQCE